MELMIAALILAMVIAGLLVSYISCLQLTDSARNTSLAMNAAQAKSEEIEEHAYDDIKNDYNNVSFTPANQNGKGVSYVDDTNSNLLKVTVTVCWRQTRGRVVGEDKDLDGQIDAGEDINVNGILDSPAEIVTYIAKRE